MNKKTYYRFIIIIIAFFLIGSFLCLAVEASTKLEGIDNFPESYKPYLKKLAEKYPNWKFVALYTGLDWNYVIDQENIFGKNLVPKNYIDRWKNTTPGQYNVEVDAGWVDCSRQAVEYCMDPRNFLNETRLFQFEGLSYDTHTNQVDGVEKILYGTEFYQKQVSYLTSTGSIVSMQETYGDLILRGGQVSLVSPYHLASRIKQEVGPFLSHKSISGDVEGFEGLYNFYNIGATSSSEPMGAIKNGLQYAKDGKGVNQETKNRYLIPWNTKERAITGGGIFIGSSYINVGQNTIYLQKFDVNDERGDNLFWHQYMTNVLAPYSESKSIFQGYQKTGILNTPMTFIIPVYENMPEIPTQSPSIDPNDYEEDKTKVYCNNSGKVNIRTGPSTSYEILTTVTYQDKMTRIQKGKQIGDRWDKVILEDGMIGYIFQTYVSEMPEVQIEEIKLTIENTTLLKGETKELQVTILPEEAKDHKVSYISSHPEIATVDEKGRITALRSGITTITVKSRENEVQSKIEIQVYSKVTGITMNQTDTYMQVGDTLKIQASIEPEDADNQQVQYTSSKSEIASIENTGRITAHREGQTIIRVASHENPQIYKECVITVVRKMEDSEIHFENPLKVNHFEVTGIEENSTVRDIKDKIVTKLKIEIVNKNNEIMQDAEVVGTGNKIQIKENGNLLREYKIILYGDANGDGKINSVDLLVLQRHILEIDRLEEIYQKACNIKKDGKKPSSADLLFIQRHILNIKKIEQ